MKRNLTLKLTILSLSLLVLAPNGASVILPNIAQTFPDIPFTSVILVLTLPFAVLTVFSFITSALMNFIPKKTLVIIGIILYLIGGLGPIFTGSFSVLLFFRGVLGAGIGVITPLASGLIPLFFQGQELASVFGLSSSFMNIGQIYFVFMAGLLVTLGWNKTFWPFLIAIPILLLIIFKLPEPSTSAAECQDKPKIKLTPVFWLIFLLAILEGVFHYPILTNTSAFIVGMNLGDSETASTVLTVMLVAGLISGFLFSKIFAKLKAMTIPLSSMVMTVGFFTMALADNLAMVYIGACLACLGLSVNMSLIFVYATAVSNPSSSSFAVAIATTGVYLGGVASSYVMSGLLRMLEKSSDQTVFTISSAAFFGFTLLSIGCLLIKRKNR
ncbi:MFS transporter [Lactonifactor longoviformis]|uniref:Predicted arabinose efflux permease, MFS family n=1 Tax=Lactonifactor longoviformis DSM 17459 TaxID=1122155 RepID=A0A1M4ZY19_9CLOT|nr:MFS transporter [Lactonifactor longoviformis]POP31832.1 MFS transporter [Lactonifactor longoviformis]SHF22844.1 Predicted arabinose efflux permease, MFS family [Lactonifactor longoviformis DSM 17459]